MICWPGQQGDTAPFEERIWREARRLCPRGVPGVLLLLRPPQTETTAPGVLIALAAAVRLLVRRSDSVLVDADYAVGVVLVEAELDGARVVARRLLAQLMAAGRDAPATADVAPFLTLGVGYSAFASSRPLDRWHADGALRSAIRPRFMAVVPYPGAAHIPSVREDEHPLAEHAPGVPLVEAPRLRVMRRGGQRAGERALVVLDRSARKVAVGAATTALTEIDEDELSALRVVRFANAPSGEHDRLRLRALAMGVPFLHLPAILPEDCRVALAAGLARELRAVPIGRTETALTVALDARWDARVLFRLRAATGLDIFPVLTLPDELERALAQLPSPRD